MARSAWPSLISLMASPTALAPEEQALDTPSTWPFAPSIFET